MKTTCCNSKKMKIVERHAICINPKCGYYLCATSTASNLSLKNKSLVVLAITFLLTLSLEDFSRENNEFKTAFHFTPHNSDIISIDVVQHELQLQNVLCRKVALAQIRIESANLTSYLFKRTNNMTGMRYPFQRMTNAIGIYLPQSDTIILGTSKELKKYHKINNYAVFLSWKDCITDYKLWQEEFFDVSSLYLEYLGKVYAKDSAYITKIKQVSSIKN